MSPAVRLEVGLKKILGSQYFPILVLLAVSLAIGVLTLRDYGESWDELQFFKYADHALESYSTWPLTGTIPLTGNTYDNYGPAYVMVVALGARGLKLLLPYTISDLRHLLYFITFLVSIWAFYEICKRWLSATASLGASLLYATQPLFWGHAFISPKDIPFLTFFLLSLLFGFRMADSFKPLSLESRTARAKRSLLVFTTFWLLSVFGLFAATNWVHIWIDGLVHVAAAGSSSFLPSMIASVASGIHKVKPEVYTQKFFVLFLRLRDLFFLLATLLLAWLWHKVPGVLPFLVLILPPAIFLGITTSIRVIGPFAGLLVIGYALWKSGRTAVPLLVSYAILTLVPMYLTWPYLWPDPIGHLIESARVMAEYPWNGQVLFNGSFYASTAIPRSYLPVLLGIQLTEPVWFLFAIGLGIVVYDSIKKRPERRSLLTLVVVWFILPLAGFILTRSPLYDNFRQVFFILPPVFMMAGVAFERIRRPALQALLIGLLVLPGIVDGARIHPYEYVYYNRFIGGVQGAYRKFELDYWGTSYRAAAAWLNDQAPQRSTVWVEGPTHILQLYVRRDLKIYSTYEAARADHYDYVVATSRYNLDQTAYPAAKVIYTIMRDGAILTAIKQP
jgi:Dolichyl-phosphate-mannose-protein mannosyltransferase